MRRGPAPDEMGGGASPLEIHHGDCVEFLSARAKQSIDMIYVDPPFNCGYTQKSTEDASVRYRDSFSVGDYVQFTRNYLSAAHTVLKDSGTIYIHLDYHSVFDVKPVADEIFGRHNFLNHVIWAYDYGGRGKNRWPRKHDDILVYVKSFGGHVFNWDDIDKIPYMAPGLQKDADRAAAGKNPTDVWWMSIVGTQSKEREFGGHYPTQKPVKLVERAIRASCPVGGTVLDFFAGSGTTGEAALNTGRTCILVDSNEQAVSIMRNRFR